MQLDQGFRRLLTESVDTFRGSILQFNAIKSYLKLFSLMLFEPRQIEMFLNPLKAGQNRFIKHFLVFVYFFEKISLDTFLQDLKIQNYKYKIYKITALRKHAYSNILKISLPKTENFR